MADKKIHIIELTNSDYSKTIVACLSCITNLEYQEAIVTHPEGDTETFHGIYDAKDITDSYRKESK